MAEQRIYPGGLGLAYFQRFLWLVVGALLLTASVSAEDARRHYLYGAFGVMDFSDEDVVTLTDEQDRDYDGDLGNRPYGGGFVQFPLNQADLNSAGHWPYEAWGYETGGYISWKNHTSHFRTQEGSTQIYIENEFFMLETFLGLFGAVQLGDRLRLSVSAGPTFVYGRVSFDEGEDEAEIDPHDGDGSLVVDSGSSDSDITLAGYIRIGVDLRITEDSYVGLSAKTIDGDLELDDTLGTVDLEGPYVMLTFSRRIN